MAFGGFLVRLSKRFFGHVFGEVVEKGFREVVGKGFCLGLW